MFIVYKMSIVYIYSCKHKFHTKYFTNCTNRQRLIWETRDQTTVACHFVMVGPKICLQIPWPNFKKLQQTLLDIIYFSLKVENGNVIKIKKKQKNVEFILRYYVIGLHMYCSFQRSIKTWMNSLHCTMNVLFYIVSMHCTQIQP